MSDNETPEMIIVNGRMAPRGSIAYAAALADQRRRDAALDEYENMMELAGATECEAIGKHLEGHGHSEKICPALKANFQLRLEAARLLADMRNARRIANSY